MVIIVVIGNSLLYSLVNRWVSLVHVAVILINAIGNSLLYIVGGR